jgi:hypothetical protein
LRLKIFHKLIITFFLLLSNSFAKNVYFLGDRGEFYQSLFRYDSRVNYYLSKDLEEADILIMLQPDMREAKKNLQDEKFKKKKFLFVFYYHRPKEFEPLPHIYLLPASQYLDTIENEHVSNSPFEKPSLTKKVKLAIQYEVWIELFRHLEMAKKISELGDI